MPTLTEPATPAVAAAVLPTIPTTTNKHLIRWVEKMAELTQPDSIYWVDGSQAEYDLLCEQLVHAGTTATLAFAGT